MRNLFITTLLLASFVVNAQIAKPEKPAKPFKVSIAGGYASPVDNIGNNDFVKPGFVYSLEPQYELSKNLEVGLRLEQAFIKRSEALDNDLFYASKVKSMLSATATVNYVIDIGSVVRPYVGVGVGAYYTAASEQTYQSSGSSLVHYPLPATATIGGLGRVGVKFGILNVEANYNLISETSVTNAAARLTLTAKNSYFSVKAGITIGGSR
ncbi:outer membrane beta-barrel protein [Spirosoma flavum]|uniref:Outer membrane beta-barrel protein n=1 Tax=Spirosoma flavum TaxID=2048557 RepID=A0ABW6AGT2_9BACT